MKPESSRALLWFAGILILIGLLVMSPSAQFLFLILGALAAVAPAMSGSRSTRIAGCVVLVIALAFAVILYPRFKKDQQSYVERARKHASPAQAPAPQK